MAKVIIVTACGNCPYFLPAKVYCKYLVTKGKKRLPLPLLENLVNELPDMLCPLPDYIEKEQK